MITETTIEALFRPNDEKTDYDQRVTAQKRVCCVLQRNIPSHNQPQSRTMSKQVKMLTL